MTLSLIAAAVSFVLTLLIGRFLIPELRKLKAGQEIREDGPTWHKSKAGTPTMGGIMFILGAGVTVFILGWSFMLEGVFWHLYVYLFALIFGLIGFVDDYRKVRQHQNEGLTARQKFILQLAAAVVFLVLMRYEGLLTNDLYIPFLNMSFTINWICFSPSSKKQAVRSVQNFLSRKRSSTKSFLIQSVVESDSPVSVCSSFARHILERYSLPCGRKLSQKNVKRTVFSFCNRNGHMLRRYPVINTDA